MAAGGDVVELQERPMPVYTFELRDGGEPTADESGVILPDREHALAYAHDVVRELLKGREKEARTWRLNVYEDSAGRVFEIPFATLDQTLDGLQPELRRTIEVFSERHWSLREAFYDARATVRESRALIAMSRGKPYLAAERGERTIR
jgi:hypothetical protein